MPPVENAPDRGAAPGPSGASAPAEREAPPLTGLLAAVAIVSAISGLLYGYDTGIIAGALLQITDDFSIGEGMKQVITAAILAGAVVGALTCSRLSERRGRRGTILMLAIVFAVGAVAAAASPSPILLTVSRFLLGFAVGGATQTVPMYVAELAPPKRRGRLVLTFQVAIGVGIVISTIVGALEVISWRVTIGIAAVPAVAMFVLMLRLPESPRWLVKDGDRDAARASLARVRPDDHDVAGELEEIVEAEREKQEASTRGWTGLRSAWVRPAVVVSCGIAVFTQLSGIEMIIYYSPTILTDNGFSDTAALRVSVALGVTYLVMMLVGLAIVDRVGRRRLTLVMIPGAGLALAALGAIFVTGNDAQTGLIIACLIVFMFFNAGGLQLMGWLTGSEIYPLGVRSAGTAATAASLWGTNLLITVTLLTMISAIGVGPSMWVYAGFNAIAWLFVWLRMPELTGRSLEQIEGSLARGRFKPADFERDRAAAPRGEPAAA